LTAQQQPSLRDPLAAQRTEPASPPHPCQALGKTLGQLWGLLVLTVLFGMGGYRLTLKGATLFQPEPIYYGVYSLLLAFGAAKGEFLFRRKFIPRTLARGRDALGETGWRGDYVLAPFCMLSLYRPWQKKHAILSWVLLPVMVALAVIFARDDIIPDSAFKGGVDLAIGLALAYAALVYVVYGMRFLSWWVFGPSDPATMPLPARKEIS
jgi:hypothetical protein